MSFFLFSALASSAIGFLTLPLYTRLLDPNAIGIIETFNASTTFFSSIILLGAGTLVLKDYWSIGKEKLMNLIGNIIVVQIVVSIVLVVSLCLIYIVSPTIISKGGLTFELTLLALFVSLTIAIHTLYLTLLQIEGVAVIYFLIVVGRVVLEHIVSFILIIFIAPNFMYRFIGAVFSSLVFSVIVFMRLKKEGLVLNLERTNTLYIFRLGIPLVFSEIAGWGLQVIDRFMINGMKTVADTGIYSVGYKFGMLVMIFDQAFGRTWISYFMKNISKNETNINKDIVRRIYIYFSIFLIVLIVYSLFVKELMGLLLDKRYISAGYIAIIVAYSYFFDGIWRTGNAFLVYHGMTKTYSVVVTIAAILNVALNYLYIGKYGIAGAAWATFFSMVFGALVTMIIVVKVHKMPWVRFRHGK